MLITAHEHAHVLIKVQCCSITRHFYTVFASGMNCRFCGKAFNRGFNLRRHENEYCPLKTQAEREMSEAESSQTVDTEDCASTTSTDEYESPITTDNEMDVEEEENDPWMPMVEEAMQKHKAAFEETKMNLIYNGLDEKSAGQKAYSDILPILQKDLESIYKDRLLWIKQLKSDPVHKKIMQTKNNLVDKDDFDSDEAMEAAVEKRKFLIKRLLKDYIFTEDSDDEDN